MFFKKIEHLVILETLDDKKLSSKKDPWKKYGSPQIIFFSDAQTPLMKTLNVEGYKKKKKGNTLFLERKDEISSLLKINVSDLKSVTFQNISANIQRAEVLPEEIISIDSDLLFENTFVKNLKIKATNSKIKYNDGVLVTGIAEIDLSNSHLNFNEYYIHNLILLMKRQSDMNSRYKSSYVLNASVYLDSYSSCSLYVLDSLSYKVSEFGLLTVSGSPKLRSENSFKIETIKEDKSIVIDSLNSEYTIDKDVEKALKYSCYYDNLSIPDFLSEELKKINKKPKEDLEKQEKEKLEKEKRYKQAQKEMEEKKLNELLIILDNDYPSNLINDDNISTVIELLKHIIKEKVELTEKQEMNKNKLCDLFDINGKDCVVF